MKKCLGYQSIVLTRVTQLTTSIKLQRKSNRYTTQTNAGSSWTTKVLVTNYVATNTRECKKYTTTQETNLTLNRLSSVTPVRWWGSSKSTTSAVIAPISIVSEDASFSKFWRRIQRRWHSPSITETVAFMSSISSTIASTAIPTITGAATVSGCTVPFVIAVAVLAQTARRVGSVSFTIANTIYWRQTSCFTLFDGCTRLTCSTCVSFPAAWNRPRQNLIVCCRSYLKVGQKIITVKVGVNALMGCATHYTSTS